MNVSLVQTEDPNNCRWIGTKFAILPSRAWNCKSSSWMIIAAWKEIACFYTCPTEFDHKGPMSSFLTSPQSGPNWCNRCILVHDKDWESRGGVGSEWEEKRGREPIIKLIVSWPWRPSTLSHGWIQLSTTGKRERSGTKNEWMNLVNGTVVN